MTDGMIKDAHILLIGRPATNRLTARLAKALPVSFGSASFTLAGETYGHPHTAIVAAGPNPLAADRSVVVFAGLSAEGTWTCPRRFPDARRRQCRGPAHGSRRYVRRLAVPASGEGRESRRSPEFALIGRFAIR